MRILGRRGKTCVAIGAFAILVGLSQSAIAQTCGTPGEQTTPAARASLAAAEQDASATMSAMGFGETLPGVMNAEGTLLIGNAPILRGRDNLIRVLTQSSYRKATQRWQPLRVLVSRDGRLGATFGVSAIETGLGEPSKFGRYISVWRCDSGNSWEMVAHVDVRSAPPQVRIPAGVRVMFADSTPSDAFARADVDFAQMAADSGAPPAFFHFAAPDAITFAGGGEINVGPTNIRARMMENRGGAQWRWHPVRSFVAQSGDLAATIGEAEISVPNAPVFYSKYLTVWQKQPDGSIKFVVDGGNARPPRPLSTPR